MKAWRYWLFEHHDKTVWECLQNRPKGHYGRGFRLDELAKEVGRTEKSVNASLRRLAIDQAAISTQNGWFGGNRP